MSQNLSSNSDSTAKQYPEAESARYGLKFKDRLKSLCKNIGLKRKLLCMLCQYPSYHLSLFLPWWFDKCND
jgi:hypothetical protein